MASDELSRIERIYGSVAEYNRVMYEESQEYYEPTKEEQIKSETDMTVYHEKIKRLDGIPSKFSQDLAKEWKAKEPKESGSWTMSDVYAWQDYGRAKKLDICSKLCEHYGVELGGNFYRIEPNTFAIDVEYNDSNSGQIKNQAITGMNYEQFKNVFRDLYFAKCSPTMNYCDAKGENHILSNCSLGNLRISDFRRWGLETYESLNTDLQKTGFDEPGFRNKTINKIMAQWGDYEGGDFSKQTQFE